MRVLIFGASGQDARILKRFYETQRAKVFLVSRNLSSGTIQTDYTVPSLIAILNATIPDLIYFTAAQSSVSKSFRDQGETIRANSTIVTNFLEAFCSSGLNSKIAWFNSSEIYGASTENKPHDEQSEHRPQSPYALSKSISSRIFSYYTSSYNIEFVEAILFNHESNFRSGDYFVIKAVRELYKVYIGEIQSVNFGNLSVSRDFGGAINYMEILAELMSSDFSGKINICSGKSIMLREIVEFICEYFNLDFHKVISIDENLFRSNEPKLIVGNNSKLQDTLVHNNVVTDFFVVLKEILDDYVSAR